MLISLLQVQVSPLENALETLDATNQKLKALIDHHKMEPSLRVDPLGGVLSGIVDAAVSGGISNYKVSLFIIHYSLYLPNCHYYSYVYSVLGEIA